MPTPLPFSPFIDVAQVDPENRFVLDQNRFMRDIMGRHPVWSPAEDPPPLFIGAPSDDFIKACHRDLLPLLEDLARCG